MKNIDNKKLDDIGRKLLEVNKVRAEEIERIVNRPQLFSSVLTQIRTEEARRQRENIVAPSLSSSFGIGKLAFAFGALAVLIFGAGWLLLKDQTSQVAGSKTFNVAPQTPIQTTAETTIPVQPITPGLEAQEVLERKSLENQPVARTPMVVQRVNLKKQPTSRELSAKKAEINKRPLPSPLIDKAEPFYALNYTGGFDETVSHPIVRVEIPRVELYSLGANIAVENEPQTVVADLLLGSDGNPRAYRLVR